MYILKINYFENTCHVIDYVIFKLIYKPDMNWVFYNNNYVSLYRGEDILLYLSPLICLSQISFVSMCSLRLSCRRLNTRRWPNSGLLLAHRLRRWANIHPVLSYRVVVEATLNVGHRRRRRTSINPAFVFDLNRPKRLKNKQKTATRHTGTLECGYTTSFSAD